MAVAGIRADIRGMKQLQRKLQALGSPARQRKAMRPGITKASRLIAKAAKKYVPKGEGLTPGGEKRTHLRTAISQNVKTYASGNVVGVIGPRRVKDTKAFHGPIIEKGTDERSTKKGTSRGRGPAFNFLAKAIDTAGPSARAVLSREIKAQIEKLAMQTK